jgi:outer membrane lipoprotein-sorting protein
MSRLIALVVFLYVCCALTAQESSPTDILQSVAQANKNLKSLSIEATIVLDFRGHRMEIPIAGAVVKPDKFRFEIKNQMMGSQTISDGRNTWKYVDTLKQYTRKSAAKDALPLNEGAGDIFAGENVMDRLQAAKLFPGETLFVDGREVRCAVIEAEYASGDGDPASQKKVKTFWVDEQRGVILKARSLMKMNSSSVGETLVTQSTTVTSIRLNQPVPGSSFVFIPPAGAREVAEIMPSGMKASGPEPHN